LAIDQIAQSGLSSLKVIYYSEQLFRRWAAELFLWRQVLQATSLSSIKNDTDAMPSYRLSQQPQHQIFFKASVSSASSILIHEIAFQIVSNS
ncbi:hypothetical protein OMR58_25935, partial [Erwinia sp. INIA-01]|uniref:hypothetical protein n=1 Tax=Erwinia sp. INIA01 TaxID=2991500 RepID=UPI0022254FF7